MENYLIHSLKFRIVSGSCLFPIAVQSNLFCQFFSLDRIRGDVLGYHEKIGDFSVHISYKSVKSQSITKFLKSAIIADPLILFLMVLFVVGTKLLMISQRMYFICLRCSEENW